MRYHPSMGGMHRVAVMFVLAAAIGWPVTAAGQAGGSASTPVAAAGSNAAGSNAAGSRRRRLRIASAAPVKDPVAAKKFLAAAQQLIARGNALAKSKPDDAKAAYDNAVTALQRAIEAGDDVNVYFQLGQAEDKLEAFAAAYTAYHTLAAAPAAQPALVKQAKARLDDVATKVGLVTLTITPDDTNVELDHVAVGTSPLKQPLVLMPGTYTLSLAAVAGYQPKEVQLQVDPGSETDRKIDLEPNPIITTTTTAHTEPPPPQAKPPSKLPLYIGAGATGAFLLTTFASGIVALADHSTFVGRTTDAQDRFDAQINGRHAAEVSDVFLGASVAAAGFTAAWYFWKYRKPQGGAGDDTHNPNAPKLDLGPWVQPDATGLMARATF